MSDLDDDLALAGRLLTAAAALAGQMRTASDLNIRMKSSISDVVTAADHAAEELIVTSLLRERPEDGVLGEEGAERDGITGRRWVIDPVDGTYNFASGSDYWCSALALVDGQRPVLGGVAHVTDGLFLGGPRLGTTWNGRSLPSLEPTPLAELSAATYLHPARIGEPAVRDPFLRAARLPATLRMHGSGSMDLVGVATGRIGVWFQHSVPSWDWLPGAAIVAGVGGETCQVEVDGYTWSVAGAPGAVGQVCDALAGRAA